MFGSDLGMLSIVNTLNGEVTRREHEQTVNAVRHNISNTAGLRGEVAELRLYMATILKILISRGFLTSEEFTRIAKIVDGFDGIVDGRFDGELTSGGGKVPETEEQVFDDRQLQELAKAVDQITGSE